MIRKFGMFWSASGLLASALVAIGISSADAVDSFADWNSIEAGYIHTCGIRHGGKLYCWGYDNSAQVGDGNNPDPALAPRRI